MSDRLAGGESPVGREFVTPSGRRWRCHDRNRYMPPGTLYLAPLGSDTHSGGGVRGMYVAVDRLDGTDKVWKLA